MSTRKNGILLVVPLASLLVFSPAASADPILFSEEGQENRITLVDSEGNQYDTLYEPVYEPISEPDINDPDHPDYQPPKSWWSEFSSFLEESDFQSMMADFTPGEGVYDPDPDWL